jgi:hypothetical protein
MLIVLVLATAAGAQDHANCPMMRAQARQAGVDARHDSATGVSHHDAVHHFRLGPDGGSIQLEVKDAAQVEARDRIREHLQVVARAFAEGDFAFPMLIHDQTPPGVPVMKERKAFLRYRYEPTVKGGLVRISTDDAQALAAVHAFLRFQVEDHHTGDPTE